ncbi:hypothetical protein TURU_071804 [Turdus rufiventris]|nr:hypothetical protein TURU_071804 [Turdus rufiventris]
MLGNLANLGPSQYTTFFAMIYAENNLETVGSLVNKLRKFESMISGTMQAHVSTVVKSIQEQMREMREEMRIITAALVPITDPKFRAQCPSARERVYTPQADLWFFLRDHGEDMGKWNGKPTSVLAAQVHQLREGITNQGSSTKVKGDGGSQELTLLEAEVSLTGKECQKYPIVTGPEAPCILGIDFLWNSYYKDPKGLRWAFGIAAVAAESNKQLNTLPGLSENPSAVGLLKVTEQQVPIATLTVHHWQYQTNRDAMIPIPIRVQCCAICMQLGCCRISKEIWERGAGKKTIVSSALPKINLS